MLQKCPDPVVCSTWNRRFFVLVIVFVSLPLPYLIQLFLISKVLFQINAELIADYQ